MARIASEFFGNFVIKFIISSFSEIMIIYLAIKKPLAFSFVLPPLSQKQVEF